MSNLTRKERQQILDDFIEKHGGWDARKFMEEVRETRGQHPAWTWFTWDDEKAAEEYRVWEARIFARGLRVKFSIEVKSRGKIKVLQTEGPAVFSPLSTRQHGGGYVELDPNDPENMSAFCDEASQSLASWLHRYSGAVAYAGGSPAQIEKLVALLSKVSGKQKAA